MMASIHRNSASLARCRGRCHCRYRISLSGNDRLGSEDNAVFTDSWKIPLVAKGDGNVDKWRPRNRLILLYYRLPLPLRRYAPSWKGANPQLTADTRSKANAQHQPRPCNYPFDGRPRCCTAPRRGTVDRKAAMGATDRTSRPRRHPLSRGAWIGSARQEWAAPILRLWAAAHG